MYKKTENDHRDFFDHLPSDLSDIAIVTRQITIGGKMQIPLTRKLASLIISKPYVATTVSAKPIPIANTIEKSAAYALSCFCSNRLSVAINVTIDNTVIAISIIRNDPSCIRLSSERVSSILIPPLLLKTPFIFNTKTYNLSNNFVVTTYWEVKIAHLEVNPRLARGLTFKFAPALTANLLRIDLKIQILEVKPQQICSPVRGCILYEKSRQPARF